MLLTEEEIIMFVEECTTCMSFDHFTLKAKEEGYSTDDITSGTKITLQTKNQTYSPLIGDVCYRFKRESKERFFRNRIARRIFLATLPHLRCQMKKKVEREVLNELEVVAKYFEDHIQL